MNTIYKIKLLCTILYIKNGVLCRFEKCISIIVIVFGSEKSRQAEFARFLAHDNVSRSDILYFCVYLSACERNY